MLSYIISNIYQIVNIFWRKSKFFPYLEMQREYERIWFLTVNFLWSDGEEDFFFSYPPVVLFHLFRMAFRKRCQLSSVASSIRVPAAMCTGRCPMIKKTIRIASSSNKKKTFPSQTIFCFILPRPFCETKDF